jgi:sugar phosphate isomerase/epimerase
MMKIGMSTSCVYPLSADEGFRFASLAGFDGVEVMVTRDPATQTAHGLRRMMDEHQMPVLSIHAPVLLLTHFVWGRDPQIKLEKAAELAAEVGASTVVVHPPFRWQSTYAERFLDIVRQTGNNTGVNIAVENMFPWRVGSTAMEAYAPGPDPRDFDCDAVTLDFSHAALSGHDALELTHAYGERLRHVHLCDGAAAADDNRIFDEHLLPGEGRQPVAEVLRHLANTNWDGHIVAEVNTRKAKSEAERLDLLLRTLAFAREHTAAQPAGSRVTGELAPVA